MKFIVDREKFAAALSHAARVARKRTPRPQLSCAHIDAEKGGVVIRATDCEISVGVTITAVDVHKPGAALVLADRLAAIVASETETTLTLETDGDMLVVSGRGKYTLAGYKPAEFPPPTKMPDDMAVCPAADLSRQLGRVYPVISNAQGSRYAPAGMLWKFEGKKVSIVGTDGHRMALASLALASPGKGLGIVPAKASADILAALADAEGDAKFGLNSTHAGVQFETPAGSVEFTSSLVEGAFPPYSDIIPEKSAKGITVNTEQFVAGIASVSAVLANDTVVRGVRIEVGDGGVRLSARAAEIGSVVQRCDGKGLEGVEAFAMNRKYATEAAKATGTEEFTIEQTAPNKAHAIRSEGLVMVLMPLNPGEYAAI